MSTLSAFILGRVLLALAFAGPGAAHFMASLRQRNHAAAAIGAAEVAAGLALMLGWQLRWLALAAAVFLIVDALVAHAFWNAVPQDQRNQLLHFFKNIALAGAFILLGAVDGQAPAGQ
ncbi:DoxX family membrane protein [Polaromonas jejuensis]|uniref:DoxX family membrane protein n=1 Tax=Polaromonas jejuensis TaxID=457502 RepID=A0ABW0QF49_9BURK|nr:DoxX family membrane protein [Polaromonas jejuensis]